MNRILAALTLSVLLAPSCRAALPEGDKVFAAMNDELSRSMDKLNMDGLGKPYFLAYRMVDGRHFEASASFGALETEASRAFRRLTVDLRVGSPRFDNSNYAPSMWEGYNAMSDWEVTPENDYGSLRFSVWSATDKAYKQALELLSKKRAFVESRNMSELYDDLTPQAPYRLFRPAAAERLDEEAWKGALRRVSAVFRKYPAVKSSIVRLHFESGAQRFLNSEGSANMQPYCSGGVSIVAAGYAPDGFRLVSSRDHDFCLAKDAPSAERLAADAEELGAAVTAMTRSSQGQAYIGPVLFQKDAAGKFFEDLLVNNLANPREVWTEKSQWSDETLFRRAGQLVERLGMRVMPPFLSVVDDPSARYHEGLPLAGFYEADDEGVPAKPVTLVSKGRLSEYYMSRAATRDFKVSNGHGRAASGEYASGSPSNVFIKAENVPGKVLPSDELRKRFIALCKEQELEYCFRLKGLDSVYAPFSAWKVYPDGREEPAHGIEFSGVNLRALRDIVAVSTETWVYDLNWTTPGSIVTPDILVQEMEIKKTEEKPERKPYLPHPYFGK